jgi:hypothetical protein
LKLFSSPLWNNLFLIFQVLLLRSLLLPLSWTMFHVVRCTCCNHCIFLLHMTVMTCKWLLISVLTCLDARDCNGVQMWSSMLSRCGFGRRRSAAVSWRIGGKTEGSHKNLAISKSNLLKFISCIRNIGATHRSCCNLLANNRKVTSFYSENYTERSDMISSRKSGWIVDWLQKFSLFTVCCRCDSVFLPGQLPHDGADFLSFSSVYWLEQFVGLQPAGFGNCPAWLNFECVETYRVC